MAISISDSVEISRPAGEVFAYLIDVNNDRNWQKGLAEAEFTSEGPVAVGATGVHRAKVMGITVEVARAPRARLSKNRCGCSFASCWLRMPCRSISPTCEWSWVNCSNVVSLIR